MQEILDPIVDRIVHHTDVMKALKEEQNKA